MTATPDLFNEIPLDFINGNTSWRHHVSDLLRAFNSLNRKCMKIFPSLPHHPQQQTVITLDIAQHLQTEYSAWSPETRPELAGKPRLNTFSMIQSVARQLRKLGHPIPNARDLDHLYHNLWEHGELYRTGEAAAIITQCQGRTCNGAPLRIGVISHYSNDLYDDSYGIIHAFTLPVLNHCHELGHFFSGCAGDYATLEEVLYGNTAVSTDETYRSKLSLVHEPMADTLGSLIFLRFIGDVEMWRYMVYGKMLDKFENCPRTHYTIPVLEVLLEMIEQPDAMQRLQQATGEELIKFARSIVLSTGPRQTAEALKTNISFNKKIEQIHEYCINNNPTDKKEPAEILKAFYVKQCPFKMPDGTVIELTPDEKEISQKLLKLTRKKEEVFKDLNDRNKEICTIQDHLKETRGLKYKRGLLPLALAHAALSKINRERIA